MTCADLQTYPVVFTEDDTLPTIGGKYWRDITGLTFTLTLVQPDGTEVNRPHNVIDEPNGLFEFQWQAGDLVAGDKQLCTVKVDNGSGGIRTLARFLIDVKE